MRYFLLAALTLALVALTRGSATNADNMKICDYLEEVENKRARFTNSITARAISVGVEVSEMLGNGSDFAQFIREKMYVASFPPMTQTKYLASFRCNYKKMILCNRKYNSNPEYRNIYNDYKAQNNADASIFDISIAQKARKMLNSMESTSIAKLKFNDALKTYLDRKIMFASSTFNRFLEKAKADYKCTYEIYYL
ncbi:uncharacterized protein LOC113564106 [Drosophila erecta]|uniref:uncharacterized protein LOC113564106 n=1 Tax=Drosophila erecta TaxID=7220 RepID=UPI000F06113B|nr:uncharacterized protein LOC113564106 [Drosophila erecta]